MDIIYVRLNSLLVLCDCAQVLEVTERSLIGCKCSDIPTILSSIWKGVQTSSVSWRSGGENSKQRSPDGLVMLGHHVNNLMKRLGEVCTYKGYSFFLFFFYNFVDIMVSSRRLLSLLLISESQVVGYCNNETIYLRSSLQVSAFEFQVVGYFKIEFWEIMMLNICNMLDRG